MHIAVINKIWHVPQSGTTSLTTKRKCIYGGVLLFVSLKISLKDNNNIAFCPKANDRKS